MKVINPDQIFRVIGLVFEYVTVTWLGYGITFEMRGDKCENVHYHSP